jgi:hypoxanthine phosphoribosyltransferase
MNAIVTEVIREAEIRQRVSELGEAVSRDYEDRKPILIGVLTGAMWFFADLIRSISVEMEVEFFDLLRFGEGGRIRLALDSGTPLVDRDVILVEDIVDTGLTLTVLKRMLVDRGAASVSVVTLLDKVPRRLVDVSLDYRGFEVGDEFLLGYGLDYQGKFRNLRSLWSVLDLPAFQTDPDVLFRAVADQH